MSRFENLKNQIQGDEERRNAAIAEAEAKLQVMIEETQPIHDLISTVMEDFRVNILNDDPEKPSKLTESVETKATAEGNILKTVNWTVSTPPKIGYISKGFQLASALIERINPNDLTMQPYNDESAVISLIITENRISLLSQTWKLPKGWRAELKNFLPIYRDPKFFANFSRSVRSEHPGYKILESKLMWTQKEQLTEMEIAYRKSLGKETKFDIITQQLSNEDIESRIIELLNIISPIIVE